MDINDVFNTGLNLDDAQSLLYDVAAYVVGMCIYAIFVFKYYRFVASKDMFGLDLSRFEERSFRWARSILHVILYAVKYLMVFPVFAFFWFAVITLILAFLAKDQSFSETLLVALATVSAIRVTAYYDEDLSRDLAKILPFAVLAIFLIDASFFSIRESLDILKEAGDYSEKIVYSLAFLVLLEIVLRLLNGIITAFSRLAKRVERGGEDVVERDPTPY